MMSAGRGCCGPIAPGVKIHVEGIKVTSKDAVTLTIARLTFAPGGTTGWHVHPGPALVIVTTGALTKYSAGDCTAQTYTAGKPSPSTGPPTRTWSAMTAPSPPRP